MLREKGRSKKESEMVLARGGAAAAHHGEIMFNLYIFSVLQEEKNSGDE